MNNHPTIKKIQQSGYLPAIPKEFGETLNMLLDTYEYDIDELVEKLSSLPNLESTLIQALNYSTKLNRRFLTLRDAVLYLGAKNARMIAIAYITGLMLPNRKGRSRKFDNLKYWKHCLGTSIASYLISEKTGLCDKEKMFTYGLIHDIGITVLNICLPDLLDEIYTMHLEKDCHQIVAEKVLLGGITHSDIGMWLCREWGFPDEICDVVGYHHSPLLNKEPRNEVKIMYLADYISAMHFENLVGTGCTFTYAERVKEELGLTKEFIDELVSALPDEVEKLIRVNLFEL